MNAKFTIFPTRSNWVRGICGIYTFNAKLFDDSSIYGINCGRVSKLIIFKAVHPDAVVDYERGWNVVPKEEDRPAYDAIMHLLETSPRRFDSAD